MNAADELLAVMKRDVSGVSFYWPLLYGTDTSLNVNRQNGRHHQKKTDISKNTEPILLKLGVGFYHMYI